MSSKAFSKGLVEIINSSKNVDRVENEILIVFDTLLEHKEALDVFRNFGIPTEKKIDAMTQLLGKRVDPMTLDLITLTISQGYGDNLVEISNNLGQYPEAINLMEELIEITGSTDNLTIKLSELYLRSEQFDEVIEILQPIYKSGNYSLEILRMLLISFS